MSSLFLLTGEDTYQLAGLIGEGGFAKVYRATNFGNNFDDLSDDEMDSPSCVIKVKACVFVFFVLFFGSKKPLVIDLSCVTKIRLYVFLCLLYS